MRATKLSPAKYEAPVDTSFVSRQSFGKATVE